MTGFTGHESLAIKFSTSPQRRGQTCGSRTSALRPRQSRFR